MTLLHNKIVITYQNCYYIPEYWHYIITYQNNGITYQNSSHNQCFILQGVGHFLDDLRIVLGDVDPGGSVPRPNLNMKNNTQVDVVE